VSKTLEELSGQVEELSAQVHSHQLLLKMLLHMVIDLHPETERTAALLQGVRDKLEQEHSFRTKGICIDSIDNMLNDALIVCAKKRAGEGK